MLTSWTRSRVRCCCCNVRNCVPLVNSLQTPHHKNQTLHKKFPAFCVASHSPSTRSVRISKKPIVVSRDSCRSIMKDKQTCSSDEANTTRTTSTLPPPSPSLSRRSSKRARLPLTCFTYVPSSTRMPSPKNCLCKDLPTLAHYCKPYRTILSCGTTR